MEQKMNSAGFETNTIKERMRVVMMDLKNTAERIKSKFANSSNLDNNPEKKQKLFLGLNKVLIL